MQVKVHETGFEYSGRVETAILFTEDPAIVLKKAGEFLASQPVLHNIILSLLHARITHAEPGRYWVATEREKVGGSYSSHR
ncbi:MAG: hypothetical protein WA294_13405 [Acidobacteriaceae bacterium]